MSIEEMFDNALEEMQQGNVSAADGYMKEIEACQLSNAQTAKLATLRTSLYRAARSPGVHWSQYLHGSL